MILTKKQESMVECFGKLLDAHRAEFDSVGCFSTKRPEIISEAVQELIDKHKEFLVDNPQEAESLLLHFFRAIQNGVYIQRPRVSDFGEAIHARLWFMDAVYRAAWKVDYNLNNP